MSSPTPSLFPMFLKAVGGGGTTILNRAIISEFEVEVVEYEVELVAPLEVELPAPPAVELPETPEIEL